MNNQYEIVEYPDQLPIRAYFHSIDSFHMHWHVEMEILLVIKGSLHVLIQSNTYTLGEGELIVVSPNLIHATQQTEEPNQVLVLQINCGKFGLHDSNIDNLNISCVGGPDKSPQIAKLRQCVCSVMLEMAHKQQGYLHHAAAQVHIILGILLRHFPHHEDVSIEAMKAKERERMNRILDYINENYAEKVTLTELAAKEYLSVSHLSTFIRRTIGISFGEYLNSVRLKAYLECLQTDANTPLDDIAEGCGFSSPQFASALFHKTYKTTPGKYRRQLQQKNTFKLEAKNASKADGYVTIYQPTDLSAILRYANETTAKPEAEQQVDGKLEIADTFIEKKEQEHRSYHRSCVRFTSISRAYEGLLTHTQDHLRMLRREIGFTHVRFHGIFCDDMMILKPDEAGGIRYSWRLVDKLLDFLLSIQMRPFFDLTYMPSLLASGALTVFAWHGNITPPASMDAWCALVKAFIQHCISRYGGCEVAEWIFEVWNEPDFVNISWAGTEQDYFHLYAETVRVIKAHCPEAMVVGPSITSVGIEQKRWISSFTEYVRKNHVPLDAFSIHTYPEELDLKNLQGQLQAMIRKSHAVSLSCPLMKPNYAQALIASTRRQLGDASDFPIIVTEWNITMAMYNPINDTAFAGTSLLSSALACDGGDTALIHWTSTDYIEEQRTLPPEEFFGGFGLITANGIRKPSYWALWALARLGKEIVDQNDRGVVTRTGNRYVLLLYHHPAVTTAYDTAYAHGYDAGTLQQGILRFTWQLHGIKHAYRAKRHRFDPSLCDGKTLLSARGFDEPLSTQDAAYLAQAAQPIRNDEIIPLVDQEQDTLALSFRLPVCGFELVELIPLD